MLLFPMARLLRLPAINKPATIAIDFLFITRHYHIKSFRIQIINYSNRGESSTNISHQKGGILCEAVHPNYYLHRRLVVHHPESHTFPYVDAYLSDASSSFPVPYQDPHLQNARLRNPLTSLPESEGQHQIGRASCRERV